MPKHCAKSSKFQIPSSKEAPTSKHQMLRLRKVWSLVSLLLPRIGFRDNQANRVLIKSLETAFALQILQMTHDRPSPQNAFVEWGFGRKMGN
jgi:hypothetical protein